MEQLNLSLNTAESLILVLILVVLGVLDLLIMSGIDDQCDSGLETLDQDVGSLEVSVRISELL